MLSVFSKPVNSLPLKFRYGSATRKTFPNKKYGTNKRFIIRSISSGTPASSPQPRRGLFGRRKKDVINVVEVKSQEPKKSQVQVLTTRVENFVKHGKPEHQAIGALVLTIPFLVGAYLLGYWKGKSEQLKEEKSKQEATGWSRLFSLLKTEGIVISFALVCLCVSVFFSTLLPLAIGGVFDSILKTASNADFLKAAGFLGLCLGVPAVTSPIHVYLSSRVGERLGVAVRSGLLQSLLSKEASFFGNTGSTTKGQLLARLTLDPTTASTALANFMSKGFRAMLEVSVSIGIVMFINWRLALVSLLTAPILARFTRVVVKHSAQVSRELQETIGEAVQLLSERLAVINTVVTFAQEQKEHTLFSNKLESALKIANKASFIQGASEGLSRISINLGTVALLTYGGSLVLAGKLSLGTLLAFNVYNLFIGAGIGAVAASVTELSKATGAVDRVFEFMDSTSSLKEGSSQSDSGEQLPEVQGALKVEDVYFHYPGREEAALSGVTLEAPAGKVMALVGPSGSGKSTLIQLLLRMYEPSQGQISLDSTPMQDLDRAWLRRQIGVVSQSPALFSSSVRDNIAYGMPGATDEEVVAAAKAANADEFITALPHGYSTLVGQRGVSLSGGQKQRLAIARAILKRPHILILDEATSALDNESEALVAGALQTLMRGRTTIVIAHRLNTVREADKIVVMEEGSIQEMGTHLELMLNPDGIYRKMIFKGSLEKDTESTFDDFSDFEAALPLVEDTDLDQPAGEIPDSMVLAALKAAKSP